MGKLMHELLSQLKDPQDLKKLAPEILPQLAKEIRDTLLQVISQNGGHLSSNMGVVELTLAMHYVFESPRDKFVWDVGTDACVP